MPPITIPRAIFGFSPLVGGEVVVGFDLWQDLSTVSVRISDGAMPWAVGDLRLSLPDRPLWVGETVEALGLTLWERLRAADELAATIDSPSS